MKIALLDPYFVESHKHWALGLQKYSSHTIKIFHLSPVHWKWKMQAGAIFLAQQILNGSFRPDLFLVTDMLDLNLFVSLVRNHFLNIPFVVYLHENQLTYPISAQDTDIINKRDNHYAFINFRSLLAADHIIFNSTYHKVVFIENLEPWLKKFPGPRLSHIVSDIEKKSSVLPVGIEYNRLASIPGTSHSYSHPLFIWNHRWEYDKNPEFFFDVLSELKKEGRKFYIVLLGKRGKNPPPCFKQALVTFSNEIVHQGFCSEYEEYLSWLHVADIAFVSSIQDFFGISVVESIACNCIPVLPKRLAFPEHLDAQYGHLYYSTKGEALKILRNLLDTRNFDANINKQAEKYDWKSITSQYDQLFKQLSLK